MLRRSPACWGKLAAATATPATPAGEPTRGSVGGGQASGPDRSAQQLGTSSPEKGPLWRLTHKVHVLLGRFRLNEESLLRRVVASRASS